MSTAIEKTKERITTRLTQSEPLVKRLGMSVAQYERIAIHALLRVPKLANCTPASFDTALVSCVEAGLVPDGREAAILPYGDKATLIPMVGGKLRLARQATPGLSVRARCVYRGDHWEHEDGLNPILRHRKTEDSSVDPKDILAAYAIGRTPGSTEPDWEVLYRPELERYRARSRAKSHSPWLTDYGEMCEKTVLGLLLKRYPWRAPTSAMDPAAEEDAAVMGFDTDTVASIAKNLHAATTQPDSPEQRGEAQVVVPEGPKRIDGTVVVEAEQQASEPPPAPPPEKPKPARRKARRRAAPEAAPPPEPEYPDGEQFVSPF